MDLEKIRTLLDFVGHSRISELTVSEAGTTVIIRNAAAGRKAVPPPPAAAPAADAKDEAGLVRSTVAGILHQSANPGTPPLIAEGDAVEAGQALCIVEAMKVFTTVSAPFGGTVKRIFFEDGQDIGFGDLLVEIG